MHLNTIEVQPDMAELLPHMVHHLDEPIGDSAAIATYLICDAARRNELSPRGLAGRGWRDSKMLKHFVDADRRGHEDNAQRIWHLLTLEQWLQNKSVSSEASMLVPNDAKYA